MLRQSETVKRISHFSSKSARPFAECFRPGGDRINVQGVTRQPDGSYRWNCRIDTGYHKEQTKSGYWAVAFVVMFVLLAGILIAVQSRAWNSLWIPFLISGVVLLIALPLLHLSSHAEAPMEEYWMTDLYVKAGYGRSAVFTHFDKTETMTVFPDHLELVEKGKIRNIYVPTEDISFVEQFISERLPQGTSITRKS